MRRIQYYQAINEAMREEMRRDQSVFLIGEDVDVNGGVYKLSEGMIEEFGAGRVRGTPISESAFTGLAAGAAMVGLRPIIEIMYFDFITVAMDQVTNQIAKIPYMSGGQVAMPLVIRGQYGSGTAEAAQHSQHLESWFVHTPGLTVVMPSNASDAKGLLKSAIRSPGPVIFLENRVLYYREFEMPEGEWLVPIGVADRKRAGTDVTVVAIGNAVNKALEAAESVSENVSVEVIDPRTLDPLDATAVLESVKKTGRLLVVHEAVAQSGFGAEVVRIVAEEAFDWLDAPPRVLGARDVPVPFSSALEGCYIPQPRDIACAIEALCS